eukprot:365800-Chlamydomonas_euryale.AAC.10
MARVARRRTPYQAYARSMLVDAAGAWQSFTRMFSSASLRRAEIVFGAAVAAVAIVGVANTDALFSYRNKGSSNVSLLAADTVPARNALAEQTCQTCPFVEGFIARVEEGQMQPLPCRLPGQILSLVHICCLDAEKL